MAAGDRAYWSDIATIAARTALSGQQAVNANTPLTTTMTDMPGALVTITTTLPNMVALALIAVDFQCTTASGATPYALISVDGVDQSQNATFYPGGTVAVGGRATVSTFCIVSLATVGNHTFKMRAASSSSSGVWRVNSGISTLAALALPA
ncbi:hypothetical protein [Micromonospora sp. CA-246542]|uniref:hypothetical protein n=1 Tax=Micromonospora sp. CA-246542 TaxID=3239959 RepID=UPI003D8BB583